MRVDRGTMRQAGWGIALAVLALLFLFGNRLLGLIVEWLWFGEVGQQRVFWTILTTRAQLALLFGVVFFLLTFLNVWLARRASPPLTSHYDDFPIRVRVERMARTGLSLLLLVGSLVAGLLAGLEASGHWDEYLRFLHPVQFGQLDPIFKRDLGFYVFRYPFWSYLYHWIFLAVLLVTAATALVYYFDRAVEVLQGYTRVAVSVRVHLSILLGILVLVKAWGYRLDAYGLLYSTNGSFFGAGYTDLHARLVALNILTVLALVAAAGFFANTYLRALWLPAAALGLLVVASLLVGGVYPGIVQRFTVQPSELALERPYIRNHLDMTRAAYGLDRVKVSPFGTTRPLVPASLGRNRATIQDIRVWDYRPLRDTYQQVQRLKPYYNFPDVDIDRYTIGGETRQVMLAARELQQSGLPPQARRWVNEWLEYTHGYGFVMNPVNEATPDGAPVFWAGDAPQQSPPDLPVQRPQIYFGQTADNPVIAPSRTQEFDHPKGSQNVPTRYDGAGGVPLGGTLRRLLFATVFGQTNILISKEITPESRILFNRQIHERAARLAPFLSFDADPYLVVAEGRLFWIQDAYTTSRHYPYSLPAGKAALGLRRPFAGRLEQHNGDFNYIRNSVKIVTDAYDGQVRFFVADPTDPVIRSYQAAFPSLFIPMDQMPPALRSHVRYPEGLFTVQAYLYTDFHVTDPAVLFVRSDQWRIPRERVSSEGKRATRAEGATAVAQQGPATIEQDMEPFYVTMRLPDGEAEEFVLMLPFQIERPPSMPAWLCARSDGEHYGELRAYSFPPGVSGPTQAEGYIDQNPEISQEISLWDQRGSDLLRGHLLALPLDQSVLYVKPFYLVAAANRLPQLTRVVLINQGRAVMAPTLGDALAALVRGEAGVVGRTAAASARNEGSGTTPSPPVSPPVRTPISTTGSVRALVDQANQAYEAATQAQRRGDWSAYGAELRRLQETLRELQRRTGAVR